MNIGQQPLYIAFFVLATIVQFGPGLRFYQKGVPALLRLAPDMNSLVVLGSTAAWAYSVVATFAPGVLPAGTANVYYEASAVIVTLILLGRMLEAKAKGRTSEAIKRLMGLQAKSARVERNGAIRRRRRSTRSSPATWSRCAPATRCRSTAWCSRAPPSSTNR